MLGSLIIHIPWLCRCESQSDRSWSRMSSPLERATKSPFPDEDSLNISKPRRRKSTLQGYPDTPIQHGYPEDDQRMQTKKSLLQSVWHSIGQVSSLDHELLISTESALLQQIWTLSLLSISSCRWSWQEVLAFHHDPTVLQNFRAQGVNLHEPESDLVSHAWLQFDLPKHWSLTKIKYVWQLYPLLWFKSRLGLWLVSEISGGDG